ncbi:MAG: Asp-tRNA(Asn)/Glu-tRNA(Gln) amidotransferase GatCAB subunit A, partial [Betaproteobacteria bacterium]|nr:Asp-tRNA(Asn)/Glu-tRNA(Gln) amidotransferase GatCAB subunit A [Betaproteobacteria bacterium]
DCAWLLDAMAGFDPKDSTSLERPSEDFSRLFDQPTKEATDSQPLKGLKIGLPKQFFGPGLSSEVRTVVDSATAQLQALGAVVLEVDLPRTELSIPAYYVIAPAEASSNLSRFDGVRYGHRTQEASDLETLYRRSRTEGFGLEVQRRILIGAFVLSHGYYDAYYLQAQRVRRLIAQDFQAAFQGCDVILGPVAPTVAWPIAQMDSQDPMTEYLADIYTLGASLAGLPAMSLPCGFVVTDAPSARRLPVGLQLIGPQFQEAQLLAVAHAYQQATDWHYQTPKKES